MAQPIYAIVRLKWGTDAEMTKALDETLMRLVLQHKLEARIIGQSHDGGVVLYTVELGR